MCRFNVKLYLLVGSLDVVPFTFIKLSKVMLIPTHVSKKEPKTATQSKLTSCQYFCCDQQVDVEGNKNIPVKTFTVIKLKNKTGFIVQHWGKEGLITISDPISLTIEYSVSPQSPQWDRASRWLMETLSWILWTSWRSWWWEYV